MTARDTSYDPINGFPNCSSCGQAYYATPGDDGICGQCWIDIEGGSISAIYDLDGRIDFGGTMVIGDREE